VLYLSLFLATATTIRSTTRTACIDKHKYRHGNACGSHFKAKKKIAFKACTQCTQTIWFISRCGVLVCVLEPQPKYVSWIVWNVWSCVDKEKERERARKKPGVSHSIHRVRVLCLAVCIIIRAFYLYRHLLYILNAFIRILARTFVCNCIVHVKHMHMVYFGSQRNAFKHLWWARCYCYC
jgi:hypothetical protein